MKYIKKYENINDPQIGDYVKFNPEFDFNDKELTNYLKTHIGKIINITDHEFGYTVKYDDILPSFYKDNIELTREEIIDWAPDKEILNITPTLRKFNIW